ncbi:MAG TPA: CatB-related O-acetyltransferase [Rhizomicrobium sp.]|nr:CatB-related O-acetyltransferase [Rhizomicrobium sp.]
MEKSLVRLLRHDKYENQFLRRYFERQYGIKIGLYSTGFFDRWRIPPGTVIGRYSSVAENARLIDANHPIDSFSMHPYFYLREFGIVDANHVHPVPPVVEDDVWIGHGAIITPECKIVGRGSIIGAGSVVGRDVPRYAVMIGSPARLVRYRFSPEVIEAIEATQWWLLDKAELKRGLDGAKEFLTSPSVESAKAFMRATGRSHDAIAKSATGSSEGNASP